MNAFVDEAAEVINDPFIQVLNKGHGAKIRLFIATQTFADFAARTLYQMIKRFIMACVWWPFLAVTLVPFAIDGLIQRKVNQTNFDYPSPLAHRYSLYLMLGAVYLLFMGLTLPFPVPPQSIPIGIFIVAFALNVLLANTQKRV